MTTEQKLKAIIHAQVKGGRKRDTLLYFSSSGRHVHFQDSKFFGEYTLSVLDILLDPEGLKAAYGLGPVIIAPELEAVMEANLEMIRPQYRWEWYAHKILDSWLSSGAEAAIDTAYDLLPS